MRLWSLPPLYPCWSLRTAGGDARAAPRGVGLRARAAAAKGDLVGDEEGRRVGAHRQTAAASAAEFRGIVTRKLVCSRDGKLSNPRPGSVKVIRQNRDYRLKIFGQTE